VELRYEDESGTQHSMSVAAFRAAHPASATTVGVRGLAPQSNPGDPPPPPAALLLDITRADLIDVAIIEIKKRL
jgi:hypothetical protein